MRTILIILLLSLTSSAFAQVRDIGVLAGVNVPMHKGVESDAVVAVNYGQFNRNGLGFRIGAQWSPSVADIDNSLGIPVAFAYRTKARSLEGRLQSGVAGAMDAIDSESAHAEAGDIARNMAGGFLMSLFSDMEFFAGLTPGYVAGSSSIPSKSAWGDSWQYRAETWTERGTAFSLSLDAGICLNYSIWKFDIKLMPAFHYCLTDNYIYHKSTVEEGVGTREYSRPLGWFFTFCVGIAYRFD